MPIVVVAEDDVEIAVPLLLGLQDEGFRVLHAIDGHWALRLARATQPALILLDVDLPGMAGLAVCRTLRQEPAVPILLLTTQEQEQERIHGLVLGADGCLIKPINFQELLARVRMVLHRNGLNSGSGHASADRIAVGDIVLDRTTRQVWRAGQPIHLRRREFDLLCVLMENAGKALSRHELLDRVWGEDWMGDPRTLDVHICWLREKLEDPPAPQRIQTLRGYGYRFGEPAAQEACEMDE